MIVTPADDKSLDKVLKLIKKEPEELVLDGVDFDTTKKPAQRDDKGGRERSGRGRARSTDKTEQAVAASAEIPTEAQTAEAPARSRSRRKTKPEAAPQPAVEATLSEPVSVDSDRPARAEREPQLRQSDRRGERRPEERERTGVKGFGDDIPAFLRRPVIIHG
jgi:hypothetical protein